MQVLKLNLNTPASINQDLKVKLIHEVTSREIDAPVFRDGSVDVRGMEAGQWRLKALHPSVVGALVDQRNRIVPDRETRLNISIPLDLLKNTPVRDIQDANLQPVREALAGALSRAEAQGQKRGGEPIYADHWNELSSAVTDTSRATIELTKLVAPLGHDHPELVEKLQEIQTNVANFYEVFGRVIAEMQRQIQQLALERRLDDAITQIPGLEPAARDNLRATIRTLDGATEDSPFAYTKRLRNVADELSRRVDAAIPADQPQTHDAAPVVELKKQLAAMSNTKAAFTYEAEVRESAKIDRAVGGSFRKLK